MAGLLNNSTGDYGEGKHIPGKDKPRERKREPIYLESDEWLGVQNSVGARKHFPDEAQQGQRLGLHHCVLESPTQHLAQYCNKFNKDL